ncbi:hypothetical protein TrLO_g10854 [Triparma laevis f. longispina]|uniref:Mitochondrial import inner membrane translocase subunit TIM22 n=1 Tax=Triparma laevis f. longispina TaxID=1714387 RepID=A0A9W7FR18_9STRA|nr:hypothetical protein TrLO_g10854 [Triparma laevis f. longispina]
MKSDPLYFYLYGWLCISRSILSSTNPLNLCSSNVTLGEARALKRNVSTRNSPRRSYLSRGQRTALASDDRPRGRASPCRARALLATGGEGVGRDGARPSAREIGAPPAKPKRRCTRSAEVLDEKGERPSDGVRPRSHINFPPSTPQNLTPKRPQTAMTISGTFFGSIFAAWSAPPVSDSKGFSILRTKTSEFPQAFKTVGRTASVFAGAGVVYTGVSCFSESFRGVKDPINSASGAAATGFMLGLSKKRLDVACAAGLVMGGVVLAAGIGGQDLLGDKENMRRRRRGINEV